MGDNFNMQQNKLNFEVLLIVLSIPILYFISRENYLFFHTIVELISIIVAFSLFSIAWNTRGFSTNRYLMFLGIAFLFIGSIDLIHTLAYKGMNIFPAFDADLPTQLWISARYLESISLIAATYFISRKFNPKILTSVYFFIFIIINLLIFYRLFPTCYVEGVGLTTFKKISEYIISILLLFALWRVIKLKEHFMPKIRWMIYLAVILTILSEISFTFYISVYGISNYIGHIFKLISFYLIYRALIVSGLKQPYKMLFNDLQTSGSRYRKAQQIGKVGNWDYIIKTAKFWGSDEAKRIYGFDLVADDFTTEEVENCIPERERVHQALVDLIEKNKPYNLEFEIIPKDNKKIKTIQSIAALEKDNLGNPLKVSGVVIDVTKRKKTESALKESEEKFKTLTNDVLDNLEVGVFILSSDFKIIWINKTTETFFGIRRDEVLGKDKKQLILEKIQNIFAEPDDFKQKVFATYDNNKFVENFTCVIKKSEKLNYRILKHYSQPIAEGLFKDGRIEYYYDITDSKQAETEITNLLQEKEILLHEVHHRIKNNMATIESLMRLQQNSMKNKEAKASLMDAENRVKSMRMLYEKLFRADAYKEVNLLQYLSPLIDEIISVFPQKENLKIEKNIQDFAINTKLIFPLGIIINELITNAMKYAVKANKENTLLISADKVDNNMKIIVQDNGIGLPNDFKMEEAEGFGLQLVNMLADQLQAKLDVENENGAKFIIVFALDE